MQATLLAAPGDYKGRQERKEADFHNYYSGFCTMCILTEPSTESHGAGLPINTSEWTNGWRSQQAGRPRAFSLVRIRKGTAQWLFLVWCTDGVQHGLDPATIRLSEASFSSSGEKKNVNNNIFLIGLLWGWNEMKSLKCVLQGLENGKYSVHDHAGYSWHHLHCYLSNDYYGSGEWFHPQWRWSILTHGDGKQSSAEKTSLKEPDYCFIHSINMPLVICACQGIRWRLINIYKVFWYPCNI